jgi:hypothetical protein
MMMQTSMKLSHISKKQIILAILAKREIFWQSTFDLHFSMHNIGIIVPSLLDY